MDQIKIGNFIAKKRKEQNLTQEQLAEKLGLTSKAISKWECGKGLPDASIMLDLASILKISVNDLLSGETVSEEQLINKADENLVKLVKENEIGNKTSQLTHIITMSLLLIWNLINIFTIKDSSEVINRPEFIIMDTVNCIWFVVYLYLLRKNKN